jgi:hypothetical protein
MLSVVEKYSFMCSTELPLRSVAVSNSYELTTSSLVTTGVHRCMCSTYLGTTLLVCEVSHRLTPSTPPAAPRDSACTVVLGIFRRSRVPSRRPRECPPAPPSITAVKVTLHRSMAAALMEPVELRLVVAVMMADLMPWLLGAARRHGGDCL